MGDNMASLFNTKFAYMKYFRNMKNYIAITLYGCYSINK